VPSRYTSAYARPRQVAFLALTAALLLSLLAVVRPTIAAPADAGFIDHSYGTGVNAPTEDKPQSKVWFADGSWWGGLFVDSDDEYRIHKYNATNNTWAATSTVVDERNSSHADYLWDGSSLYVASVNGDNDADPILVFKFDYNAGSDTYTLDPDFQEDHDADLDLDAGLIVGQGPAETVTIAKDSTNQLWVTFDNPVDATNRKIMVNHSTTNEHTWGVATQVGDNVGPDDISAIIAYDGDSLGLLMSEHRDTDTESAFHFFTRADSAVDTMWTAGNSISGTSGFAEDHINLKLTATGSGEILAALKTNDGPNHIQLYRRATSGSWSQHVVVGAGQEVTRPQVVVDETNDQVYVLYTAPELAGDGDQAIYYKSAPLSNISFNTATLGTALIADSGQDITNVSTAKHGVTSASGLLAIASADSNTSYYHGFLALSGSGGSPFLDVPTTHRFFEDIVWVRDEGITIGCNQGGTLFCPEDNVDRDQMATFLVRALGLTGGGSTNFFTDDNGNPHERNINILRHNGLTTGCGGGGTKYCPDEPVRRDQMATFLVRAYELTGGGSTNAFTDDNGNAHERNINILANNDLTTGCNPAGTRYCPARIVSRGQMAAFLHRADTQ